MKEKQEICLPNVTNINYVFKRAKKKQLTRQQMILKRISVFHAHDASAYLQIHFAYFCYMLVL